MAENKNFQEHGTTTKMIVEGRRTMQYLAVIIVNLAAFATGINSAWTSPALPVLQSNSSEISVTNEDGSWIGATLSIGCILGSICSGYSADALGRKYTLLLIAIPYVIGYIVIIFARSTLVICIGRIITGIGSGAITVMSPMYTAEIAEVKIRGALSTIFILLLNFGFLYVYVIGSFATYMWLNISCVIIPVVFFFTFIWMPETPVYYISKNRTMEAEKSLRFFRGNNYPIEREISEIAEMINEAKSNNGSIVNIFRTPVIRRAFLICMGLMAFQQLTGATAVLIYTVQIFQDAGSSLSPNVSTIMVGAVQLGAIFLSFILIDRVGRRKLMLVSKPVCCICMAVLGTYFYLKDHGHDVSSFGWVPLVALNVFMAGFQLGAGSVPWVVLGEILPPNVKAAASAIITGFLWCLVFAVSKFFQNFLDLFGPAVTFWIFSCLCAVSVVFVVKFLPETKGKTLLQIQRDLMGATKTHVNVYKT